MKTCPACKTYLKTEDYEGTKVWRCPDCRGVFIAKYKLDIVRHQRHRDRETLKAEAKADFKSDTKQTIRCPRCRAIMEKRPIASRYSTLTLDSCKSCEGIWLDGGELALAQLVYEASTTGTESLEFQRRMKELLESPERKAKFDAAMAALRENVPGDHSWHSADILLELIKSVPPYIF
jgi:Zn-finger nucleic acid-binding protein